MRYEEKTDYREVLGKEPSGEIVVLEYTFKYSEDIKGVTGITFEVKSGEEIRKALENFEDYVDQDWKFEVDYDSTRLGLADWIEERFPTDAEKLTMIVDDSYSELHEKIKEAYDVPRGSVIHATGGGRISFEEIEWLPGKREIFEPIINKYRGE